MSDIGFHMLGNAWLLALAAPLVLFYFLKLKRPRLAVPSLVLWRQVIMDRRVNSPFQRFKRNLLLLLQLLILLLVIVAALQPFWRRRAARAGRTVVMVDCSASMAARDEETATPRLELAREKVGSMIEGLVPDDEMALIAFSNTARRICDFTDNKRLLREALDGIAVEEVPSDVEDAVRMAQSLTQGVTVDEVVLFSDGNVPARVRCDLSFRLNYQLLPEGGPNMGITSLNAVRRPEGGWDAFALVEGSPGASGPFTVRVMQDGEEIAVRRSTLADGGEERIGFFVAGERRAGLQVVVTPEAFDSLASDNVAWLDLPATRRLRVYAAPEMGAFRHALNVMRGLHVFPTEDGTAPESGYDLVVSDREEDLSRDGAVRLFVGTVPPDVRSLLSVSEEGSWVVDWRRDSQLLQHVELADLIIIEKVLSAEGVGAGDYEAAGYEVLVHGDRGPLLLRRDRGDRLDYYLLFHTDRSTLPYRVGFPVMVANAVQAALHRAGLAEAYAGRTGVLAPVVIEPSAACRIEGPGGYERDARADGAGLLSGVPAPAAGSYTVRPSAGDVQEVGASLLSSAETKLPVVSEIEFEEELSVAAAGSAVRTDRVLWPLLAALAFAVLLGEWWYYQRGGGGRAR